MSKNRYGTRLRGLRESQGLTQAQLADELGFNDRQTITAIEAGERKLSAEELVKATQIFEVTLDHFSNPFLITGEGRFCWRQSDAEIDALDGFEKKAGEWIGAYRELSRCLGKDLPFVQPRIGLTHSSSLPEAADAGDRLSAELELGDIPANELAERVEEKLGALVLMIDAEDGISGAACQIPEINALLINRNEAQYRRNFNLAHEVFHILTWDAMPPDHLDGSGASARQVKIEKLANSFAAGLLMPNRTLDGLGEVGEDFVSWLNDKATILGVSSQALKWRMINTGRIARGTALAIDDANLAHNGGQRRNQIPPLLFSRRYLNLVAEAILHGHISARRVSSLLRKDLGEVIELFEAHEIDNPFE